jgi:hypothetical protein
MSMIESKEKEKMGEERYNKLHDVSNQRTSLKYPQGNMKQEQLYESFQYDAPFYLKENKPVFIRKTDPKCYESALEQARNRFEAKLKEEKDIN